MLILRPLHLQRKIRLINYGGDLMKSAMRKGWILSRVFKIQVYFVTHIVFLEGNEYRYQEKLR